MSLSKDLAWAIGFCVADGCLYKNKSSYSVRFTGGKEERALVRCQEILKTNFYVQGGTPLIQCFIYKRNNEKLELNIRPGTKQEYKDIDNKLKKSAISGVNYKHDNK